jgi:hypothetical protein
MRYTAIKDDRQSDSKRTLNSYSSTKRGNVMKRLLGLLMITICLLFAGAPSMPPAQASTACELVCGDPFIDPNDGQCYQECCPSDEKCERMCELRPCKAGF